VLVVSLVVAVGGLRTAKLLSRSKAAGEPAAVVRGAIGDGWADTEIGKRDYTENAAREIVPFKVNAPGGVVVDRNSNPNRAYIWDSGNNRIMGLDLNKCYNQTPPCSADVVIGQPAASDYGACNLDSSFQTFPDRPPASDSSLCGVPEWTHTTLEDKSFSSMHVDPLSNLWVADSRNNRVLFYTDPFVTDVKADAVWGQPDFSGNKCNGNGFYTTIPNPPTASSLCFFSVDSSGSGVFLDPSGNLWVADGGNNRVLRFPRDSQTNRPGKIADLVFGQPNFTSGGDWSGGSGLNRMAGPSSVAMDGQGVVYVSDTGNNRILKFVPPFSNGMSGVVFGPAFESLMSVQIDSGNRGLWALSLFGGAKLFDFNGLLVRETGSSGSPTGGSIGQDSADHLLISTYSYDTEVFRYTFSQAAGRYVQDLRLFFPPDGTSLPGNNPRFYNLTSNRRLEHSAWVGVGVTANQLIVSDGRLLYWNDLASLINGKPVDGFVGASAVTDIPDPGFGQVKTDASGHVWVGKHNEIWIYQSPLTSSSLPIKKIIGTLGVRGGGQIALSVIHGIVPSADGRYLWVSQPDKNHVFRIKGPLTSTPEVDVILGQTSVDGNQCNRGEVPAPNTGTDQTALLNMLCYPGVLSIDKKGNLYVSDHTIEAAGNFRLLMFSPDLFPVSSSVILAPMATKEFPRGSNSNPYPHAVFETAFDSANHMVLGHNPYLGPRFVDFYIDPTLVNPNNHSDPDYAKPDGKLSDFYGWPVAMTFDGNDNLYAYDANRGQILIYRGPLTLGILPTPTPTITIKQLLDSWLGDVYDENSDGKINSLDFGLLTGQ